MDVGVFVELEQVGVAEFTHMGTVVAIYALKGPPLYMTSKISIEF